MKATTPTLYWGPILQAGRVIIITIDIAIDIDIHAIKNHFQNLAGTFVTPLGDFHKFFCVMGLEGDTVCINNATYQSLSLIHI